MEDIVRFLVKPYPWFMLLFGTFLFLVGGGMSAPPVAFFGLTEAGLGSLAMWLINE